MKYLREQVVYNAVERFRCSAFSRTTATTNDPLNTNLFWKKQNKKKIHFSHPHFPAKRETAKFISTLDLMFRASSSVCTSRKKKWTKSSCPICNWIFLIRIYLLFTHNTLNRIHLPTANVFNFIFNQRKKHKIGNKKNFRLNNYLEKRN